MADALLVCCRRVVFPVFTRVAFSAFVLLSLARPWRRFLVSVGIAACGIFLVDAGRCSVALSVLRLVALLGGLREGIYWFFHFALLAIGFAAEPVLCLSFCVLACAFPALVLAHRLMFVL